MRLHIGAFGVVVAMVLGLLSTTATAGFIRDTVAVSYPVGTYGYRSAMGDFITLGDGRVMMSFTDQVGDDRQTIIPAEQRRIAGIISSDQGKTWGQPFTLVDPPGVANAGYICHPSFLRAADGDILLSYIKASFSVTPYKSFNYIRRSRDDGQIWGSPTIMTTAPGSFTTAYPGVAHVHNDRLLTLSTGRILAIAEQKEYMPSTNDHEGYVGMSFYSDDQGHTWKPSDNAVDMYPVEFQEADAVELKDGRLMMFGRTYSGHPAKAYSNDKGKTWSQGELITTLDQPYPGLPTVRRIPSTGDLLFIWCGEVGYTSTGGALRSALTCAISQDEGQTFIHRQNLVSDPQGDFGYQSIEFLNNDLALVGYYARDGLHVAQVSTDWLYEAPEPGSLTLLAIGLAGVMGYTWRKRKR